MFGMMSKTATAEKRSPPIIASDMLLCGFFEGKTKANGINAAIDVALVTRIIFSFSAAPSIMLFRDAFLQQVLLSLPSHNIIELFTLVPKSTTSARIEFILRERKNSARKKIAPKNAGGSASKKIKGSENDSLCAPSRQ